MRGLWSMDAWPMFYGYVAYDLWPTAYGYVALANKIFLCHSLYLCISVNAARGLKRFPYVNRNYLVSEQFTIRRFVDVTEEVRLCMCVCACECMFVVDVTEEMCM